MLYRMLLFRHGYFAAPSASFVMRTHCCCSMLSSRSRGCALMNDDPIGDWGDMTSMEGEERRKEGGRSSPDLEVQKAEWNAVI